MDKTEPTTTDPATGYPAETAAASESSLTGEPTSMTAAQLEELQARAAKADENWQRLLQTSADFDNFKKRATRERQDAVRFANEALINKLIPVLDNFDMALGAAQANAGTGLESLQAGIAMVQQQFKGVLVEAGVVEVDATGQQFDPHQHEAVSQQESADVPEGHVLLQTRKGYKLRDRLLRPASVIVAKKPAAA